MLERIRFVDHSSLLKTNKFWVWLCSWNGKSKNNKDM